MVQHIDVAQAGQPRHGPALDILKARLSALLDNQRRPESKAVKVPTFQRVTDIPDAALARRYFETAWQAVEYVATAYADRVFLGVGMPYNRELVGLDEVGAFGRRLARIDPEVQLCALDDLPTFRRRALRRPRPSDILNVKRIPEGADLRTVVIQTAIGHIGPESWG